jgi:hypothetical protein
MIDSRIFPFASAVLAAFLFSSELASPGVAAAAQICGQPKTTGDAPKASDALAVLQAAVGSGTCEICVCDVSGDSAIKAGDALLTLRRAVGQNVILNCPPCQQFSLAVELNPDPVRPGETMTAIVRLTNVAATAIASVAVDVLLPGEIDSFPVSATSGASAVTCGNSLLFTCSAGELMTWTVGTLEAGASAILTMPMRVSDGVAAATVIDLDATARIAASITLTAEAEAVVEASRSLDLALETDAEPAQAGGALTYTLSFGNRTTDLASLGAELRLTKPQGTTVVRASDGGAVGQDGVITWDLDNVLPGQSGTRQVELAVDDDLPDGNILRATATIDDDIGSETTATADTTVRSGQPLRLTLELAPDPILPEFTVTAVLRATNVGATPLSGVVVDLLLPSAIDSFDTTQISGGPATCGSSLAFDCARREQVVWSAVTLAPGEGVTLTLPPPINETLVAGSIFAFDARVRDGSGRNAAVRRAVRVASVRQLNLSVRTDAEPVEPGGHLLYTLSYGNPTAASAAQGTTLRLRTAPETTVTRVSDGGSVDQNGVVEWDLAAVLPGDGGVLEAEVVLSGDVEPGTVLRAEAEIDELSGTRTRTSAHTRVGSGNPLALQLELNPDPVVPDFTITGVLRATNTGNLPLANVVVDLLLPGGLETFDVEQTSGGSLACGSSLAFDCSRHEQMVWTIGSLAAGQGVTLTLPPPTVDTLKAGELLTFEARVRDGSGRNAAVRRSVRVETPPQLVLTLESDVEPVPAGSTLTYSMSFGNPTTATAALGATLRFVAPAGTSVVTASDSGTIGDEGVVEWDLGTVLPGRSGARRVELLVDDEAIDGTILSARAGIDELGGARTVASADTRVIEASPLRLSLELNPDPGKPGYPVVGVVRATNASGVPLAGVVVDLLLPGLLQSFPSSATSGGAVTCGASLASDCARHEQMKWNIGTLVAGGGVTLTLPPRLNADIAAGTVLAFDARMRDGTGRNAAIRRSVRVASPRVLDVTLQADAEPVAPGEPLSWTLTYGNPATATTVTGAVLRLRTPPGVEILAASDGGSIGEDGVVSWNAGTLLPGQSGTRSVDVTIDEAVADGAILQAEAEADDASGARSRARADTRMEIGQSLVLTADFAPDPANPGEAVLGSLSATNVSGVPLAGVIVDLLLPLETDSFSSGQATGAPVTCGSSLASTCSSNEQVEWTVGTLAAAANVALAAPPPIRATTTAGSVTTFEARVRDGSGNNAAARVAVRVAAP